MKDQDLYNYILGVADNSLILGQRLGELCGHGPNLETDIALTNIALDLFGQTRSYYQYAAKIAGDGRTEDDIAMLRNERDYKNVLLVEQPNTHFGHVIARQFLFDVYHLQLMNALQHSKDEMLVAIARKGVKEVSYHKRFSGDWLKRLGDGTDESKQNIQEAIDHFWPYTDELFDMTDSDKKIADQGIGVDMTTLKDDYYKQISEVLEEATLTIPDNPYSKRGGKQGIHTEHMGYILTELQYMQRTYPNMTW
ncbi:phenylacetate-CoA oxygenase subunit PaaI [Pukyongia salina]|uniref:Phenylacetate-CoA oxygenase subunit PaaI n=1 Tax=Pukyongia salina TaxID=2094025 RepID=A0A2S0HUA2_9FLAO|nr:1,2-phenylacetyl-CoA epoxidase subunit PaaC [Pukyongia salina]AVI50196.1 phenylacetate-CoA oxygenase subunit PaaI [Pukyongia salina]